jgi:membrane protein YqaA with SNARE-associated domain
MQSGSRFPGRYLRLTGVERGGTPRSDMRFWLLLGITVVDWLHRFGGPGLILLGIVDSSVIPLPGSMDVSVVLLSSARREWWPYYAAMATLGGLAGGWLTYRIAKQGGGRTLEKKIGKRRAYRVNKHFEKKGGITVFVGAVLPPPFPIVPFLMAAGIMRYPRKKFLAALGLGRAVRYFGLAFVGHTYGTAIISFFARYRTPILYTLIAFAVLGGIAAFFYFKYYRPWRRAQEEAAGEPVEEFPVPGQENQELKRSRAEEHDASAPPEAERKTA